MYPNAGPSSPLAIFSLVPDTFDQSDMHESPSTHALDTKVGCPIMCTLSSSVNISGALRWCFELGSSELSDGRQ